MIDDVILIKGVRNLFPADKKSWCQVRKPDHAARAMLSRVIVDLGQGRLLREQAHKECQRLLAEFIERARGLDLASAEVEALREAEAAGADACEMALANLMIAMSARPEFAALNAEAGRVDATLQRRLHEAYLAETVFHDEQDQGGQGTLAPVVSSDQILHGLRDAGIDTANIALTAINPVLGGYSRQTLICEVQGGDFPNDRLVVRAEFGADYSGAPVQDEFATADALFRNGIKVPRPIGVSSAGGTAKPFMLMEWADGAMMEYTPTVPNEVLCRDSGFQLGRIHSAPVEDFAHVVGAGVSSVDQTLADIDVLEKKWRDARGNNAVIAYAINWLRDHVQMAQGPRSLTHGDYRGHNMLQKDEQITAILDWEHGRITHPARDFGYSRSFIDAIGGWDLFTEAYVAGGGTIPEPEAVRYFEIFASVFILTVLAQIANGYSGAATQQLATAASVVHRGPIQMDRLIELLDLP